MTFPTEKLINPYYFIRDNIVYEISDKNDADKCGLHLVTFKTTSLDGGDKVFVKKGARYLDEHGTPVIAEVDGYYPVSTGEIDIDTNKSVFPWIRIEYKVKQEDEATKEIYLWLDYLIEDGDNFDGEKFSINTDHYEGKGSGSYVGLFKDKLTDMVKDSIRGGYSLPEIKKRLPDYTVANPANNDTIIVGTKKVYLVSLTNSDNVDLTFDDDELLENVYDAYKEMVEEYAKRLVSKLDGNVDVCVELPCGNGGNGNTQPYTPDQEFVEHIAATLSTLNQNFEATVNSTNTLQENIENEFETIDPINSVVLSETSLMTSAIVDNNVNTYASVYSALHNGETMNESSQNAFRDELVDMLITKYNPMYNYLMYLGADETQFTSCGTWVVSDSETVLVDEEEKTYWEIKILADMPINDDLGGESGMGDVIDHDLWDNNHGVVPKLSVRLEGAGDNSIVNNRYYIESDIIFGLEDNASFELFVKENNQFVSTNLFMMVFKSSILEGVNGASKPKRKGKQQPVVTGKHGKVVATSTEEATESEKEAWNIDHYSYRLWSDGCLEHTTHFADGTQVTTWDCP